MEEREKIEIVAGDGARWIDTCVKSYFPNATRCIDFFHVAEWVNEKLDKVRTSAASKAFAEYENLKKEYQKAEAEAAKAVWEADRQRQSAEAELNAMPKRGRPSRRKRELSEKIARHRENILNSIRCQANSAKSEAVNTTIKVLIKLARGFRNIENMIALIYLKCSDLVIPLRCRPQMSAEKAAAMRNTANELRKRRQEEPVHPGYRSAEGMFCDRRKD